MSIPEISEPIGWGWEELADLIDQSRRNIGGLLVTRRIKVGKYILSVAACPGAHCELANDKQQAPGAVAPLRDYSHVEIAVIDASESELAEITGAIDLNWDDEIAAYVESDRIPLLINLLLRVSDKHTIRVPPQEVPAVIQHFKNVMDESTTDPFDKGQYGRGGPGTHEYFSFMD